MASKSSKALTAGPAIVILGLIGAAPADAEIATDGTVGPRVELGGPEFAIGADLGRQSGRNLFHSFERFSLASGERATFSGPRQIRNVISRVTGGERSDIDGTLRSTIAGADFYFINPAGILFGPNASLDLEGSFHVATADEVRFRDGARFNADLAVGSSFTYARREAFGFLGGDRGTLSVADSHLRVRAGEAISLAGGRVRIAGGSADADNLTIGTRGGTIAVGAVGPGGGEVAIRSGRLEAAERAPITITNGAVLETIGAGGGDIRIEGGRVRLNSLAQVVANALTIWGGEVLIEGLAAVGSGTVEILAGAVRLDQGFTVSAGSPIAITADRLVLRNGSLVSSRSAGDGGDVTLTLGSARVVRSQVVSNAVATHRSGDMTLIATEGTIFVSNSIVSVGGFQSASGGRLTISAPRVAVVEAGELDASSVDGPAGEIDLEARQLTIAEGGAIRASATGAGPAGEVTIDVEDRLLLTGTGLGRDGAPLSSSVTAFSGSGPAGTIMIDARRLEVSEGGLVGVPTTDPAFGGRSGAITVTVGTLTLTGEAAISATSFGATPGAVIVDATDRVVISDRGRLASAAGGIGQGGRIELTAPTLVVVDGGLITARSAGEGEAGAIRIEARDRLVVDRGRISTDSATGGGGEIRIIVGDVVDLLDSAVTTSVEGGDDRTAGNILIDPRVLVIDGSRIEADAGEGVGGLVTLVADNILVPGGDFGALLESGDISASGGDPTRDGTVVVAAPEINLAGDLLILQTPSLDAAALLGEPCAARRDVGASSFTAAGRGGLPANPNAPLPSAYRGSATASAAAQPSLLRLASCARMP